MILAFHRVLDDADFRQTDSPSGMVMRRRTFEGLCEYVKQRYEIVDIARMKPKAETGRIRIAVTFDDGWIDNQTVAFPIARAYGIPMAVFVCPGLLDRYAPFWPERVSRSLKTMIPSLAEEQIESAISYCKSASPEVRARALTGPYDRRKSGPERTLSWAELETLKAAGVTIGAHTQTHQLLTHTDAEAGWREVVGCKALLERRLHRPCDQFAYPNGNHSAAARDLVGKAGFARAFTLQRRAWTPACDPLRIPRVNMAEDDVTGPAGRFSPALFEYRVFWTVSRAHRGPEDRQ